MSKILGLITVQTEKFFKKQSLTNKQILNFKLHFSMRSCRDACQTLKCTCIQVHAHVADKIISHSWQLMLQSTAQMFKVIYATVYVQVQCFVYVNFCTHMHKCSE